MYIHIYPYSKTLWFLEQEMSLKLTEFTENSQNIRCTVIISLDLLQMDKEHKSQCTMSSASAAARTGF